MLYLRAYATLWDFVNSVFGTKMPSVIPNTYGTMMAIAFLVGIVLARKELARKTNLSIFPKDTKEVWIGKGIVWSEVIIHAFFGLILGLKFLGGIFNKDAFIADPQGFLLSTQGSLFGAFLGAILFGGYIIYTQLKEKLPEPKTNTVSNNIEDRIGDVLIIAMVGGVFGSKIIDALDNPASMAEFLSNPIASLTFGLSILGGLFTVSILLIAYAIKNKIKVLPFADSLSPPFFLAYAIGRLGCQFSGDGCWGISTVGLKKPFFIPEFLWGSRYAHNVNEDGIIMPNCSGKFCTILQEPHLPTPLYETIIVTLLFLIIWKLRKKLTYYYGAITGIFLVFNGLERFFIEFIRINTKYDYFGLHLSQAQFMSLFMIIIGLGLTVWSIFIYKEQKTAISC